MFDRVPPAGVRQREDPPSVEAEEDVSAREVIAGSWPLLASMAMLMIGAGLQGSLLGIRGPLEGFTVSSIGVILAGYFAGYVLGSSWAPHLILNVGHIRAFTGLASMASVAMLVHAVWLEAVPWLLLRFLTGVCMAGLFVIAESWLAALGDARSRGTLLAVYMVVVTAALAVGQLLLRIADIGGPALFVLTSASVSLAVVPMSLVPQMTPRASRPEPYPFRRLLVDAPLAPVAVVAAGMGVAAMLGFGAVEAAALGFDVGGVALFLAAVPAGSALMQIPLGRFSDRTDRRRVIASVGFVGTAVAVAGAMAAGDPHLGVYVLIALVMGGMVFPLYSLALAHLSDWIDPSEIVSAGAKMLILNGIGAAVSPIIAGAVVETAGPEAFWWYLAGVLTVTGAYASFRLTRREATDQVEFSPVPHVVTTSMLELEAQRVVSTAGGEEGDEVELPEDAEPD